MFTGPMTTSIAIVDYGMGNLRSVQNAFEKINHHAEIVSSPDSISRADKLVLTKAAIEAIEARFSDKEAA